MISDTLATREWASDFILASTYGPCCSFSSTRRRTKASCNAVSIVDMLVVLALGTPTKFMNNNATLLRSAKHAAANNLGNVHVSECRFQSNGNVFGWNCYYVSYAVTVFGYLIFSCRHGSHHSSTNHHCVPPPPFSAIALHPPSRQESRMLYRANVPYDRTGRRWVC